MCLSGGGDSEVARRVLKISARTYRKRVSSSSSSAPRMTPFWPEKVASRPEISPAILHALLRQATAVVHDRLLASATSQMRVAIGDVFAKVSAEVGAHVCPRDYRAAQKLVLRISSAAGLSESVLTGFCRENKFEESVVTLPRSRRCRSTLATV